MITPFCEATAQISKQSSESAKLLQVNMSELYNSGGANRYLASEKPLATLSGVQKEVDFSGMHVRPDGEKAVEKLHTFSESALHLEVRCLSRKTGLGGRKAQSAPKTCHTAQFPYQIERMISEMYVPTHISKSALLMLGTKSG